MSPTQDHQTAHAHAEPSSGPAPRSGNSVLICLLHLDLRIADNALWHFAHQAEPRQHNDHNGSTPPAHSGNLSSKAKQLVPLFVFDEREYELSGLPDYHRKGPEARTKEFGFWKTGAFRTRFAAESVYDLRSRLRERGSDLCIRFGLVEEVVASLVKAFQERGDDVEAVWMDQDPTSTERAIQKGIEERLKALHTPVQYVHGKTLIHPDDLPFDIKDTPDVFTPFRKRVEALGEAMVRPLYSVPATFKPFPTQLPQTSDYSLDVSYEVDVDGLSASPLETTSQESGQVSFYQILHYLLLPLKDPNFPPIGEHDLLQRRHHASAFPFRGGESSALERLDWYFVRGKSPHSSSWGKADPPPVSRYKQTRNNLLGHSYSTKMSPFLAYGSISPRQIWEALQHHESIHGEDQNIYWVKFELLWRDYFHFVAEKFGDLLYHVGGFELATDPPQAKKKLDGYWKEYNPKTAPPTHELTRLLEGRTGIPFIDANIRELRETGFVSNRGRQNLASYLAHDLTYDWRVGAELFESYLIDSAASCVNLGNWQYVSGVGNDPRASRRFNIIKQAKDYDSHGEYVKTWIPSLRGLPADYVHTPWLLDAEERRRYALKSSDTTVTMESYPARPLSEDEGWKKHYDRKAGDGSRMHGNPQEKIKDGKLSRSKKAAAPSRHALGTSPRRGSTGGLLSLASQPSQGDVRVGQPGSSCGIASLKQTMIHSARRDSDGSGGSSTGGDGSGTASSNESPHHGFVSRSELGNGSSQKHLSRGISHRLMLPFRKSVVHSPHHPRGGSNSAPTSSGEGSGRESVAVSRVRSKAEEAVSWRKAG